MFGFIEHRIDFFSLKKDIIYKTKVKHILNLKQIIKCSCLFVFKKAHLKEATLVYMKTFQNEMVLSSASSCLGKNNDQLMYISLNKLACRESLYWRKSSSVMLKVSWSFFFPWWIRKLNFYWLDIVVFFIMYWTKNYFLNGVTHDTSMWYMIESRQYARLKVF